MNFLMNNSLHWDSFHVLTLNRNPSKYICTQMTVNFFLKTRNKSKKKSLEKKTLELDSYEMLNIFQD